MTPKPENCPTCGGLCARFENGALHTLDSRSVINLWRTASEQRDRLKKFVQAVLPTLIVSGDDEDREAMKTIADLFPEPPGPCPTCNGIRSHHPRCTDTFALQEEMGG